MPSALLSQVYNSRNGGECRHFFRKQNEHYAEKHDWPAQGRPRRQSGRWGTPPPFLQNETVARCPGSGAEGGGGVAAAKTSQCDERWRAHKIWFCPAACDADTSARTTGSAAACARWALYGNEASDLL